MEKFQYSPDAANGAANVDAPAPDVHTRHLENVPDKDAVLLSVAQTVDAQWAQSPFVTLLWQTQPDFQKVVDSFDKDLQSRNKAGGKRG